MELSAAVQETVSYYEGELQYYEQNGKGEYAQRSAIDHLHYWRENFAAQRERALSNLAIAERHLAAIDHLLSTTGR